MIPSLLSLLFSLINPMVLEWLKSKPWFPLIEKGRPFLNAVMAALAAAGNVVSVSWAWEAATGTLTIRGLIADDIVRLGATFLLSWLLQELTYRFGVKK